MEIFCSREIRQKSTFALPRHSGCSLPGRCGRTREHFEELRAEVPRLPHGRHARPTGASRRNLGKRRPSPPTTPHRRRPTRPASANHQKQRKLASIDRFKRIFRWKHSNRKGRGSPIKGNLQNYSK